MTLRIPKAELSVEVREKLVERLGAVPEPVEVLFNNSDVSTVHARVLDEAGCLECSG